MTEPALPELPEFDPRATRRAVRRGVLRTAAFAALLVLAAWIVLHGLSYAWQTRGDSRERARVVLGTAVQLSLPGHRVGPAGCCHVGLGGTELWQTVEPRAASALRPQSQLRLRVPLVGRVEQRHAPGLPPSPVALALTGRVPPERTRALLNELPAPVAITAVVELARPLEQSEWERFLEGHGGAARAEAPPVFLEPVYAPRRAEGPRLYPIAWPEPPFVRLEDDPLPAPSRGSLLDFASWVELLEEGDERDLRALDLPPLDELRRLASPPRAHGLVVERGTRDELRAYLDDPAVRSVAIADVAFDVSFPPTAGG